MARAKFVVLLLDYQNRDYVPDGEQEVARFHAKGDAIAYAIWRAHTIPAGRTHVFEVYDGKRKEYRAG